jgi:hypothetical protein
MGHNIRIFAGPRAALRPFVTLVPQARVYALTPQSALFVLLWDDAIVDAFHAAYGTGEWLELCDMGGQSRGLHLTTSDVTFASRASVQTALVWIETEFIGGAGTQIASAWIDGAVQIKPSVHRDGELRPSILRPVNMALRLLGVAVKAPAADEFEAFGLAAYRSNDQIAARAMPVRL